MSGHREQVTTAWLVRQRSRSGCDQQQMLGLFKCRRKNQKAEGQSQRAEADYEPNIEYSQ